MSERASTHLRFGLSVVTKMVATTVFLIMATTLGGGVSAYFVANSALEAEMEFAGESLVHSLSVSITTIINKPGAEGELQVALNKLLRRGFERRITDAYILDHDLRILAAKDPQEAGGNMASRREQLRAVLTTRVLRDAELGTTVVSPVQWGKQTRRTLGYVLLSLSDDAFARARNRVIVWYSTLFLVAFCGAVLATRFVVKRLLRPVVALGTAAQHLADGDFDFPLETPRSGDEIGVATQSFLRMREAQSVFVRFSNPALVRKIMSGVAPDRADEVKLTIGFGDGVRFTAWSTSHTAAEIGSMLTDYFTLTGLLIERYNGIVEKFIGDAVMSYFGLDEPDRGRLHAQNALRSKVGAQIAIALANHAFQRYHGRLPLRFRFGLASGKCIVGPIGATGVKLDYTLVGDPVNLASRLEAQAEPGGVAIDKFTFHNAGEDAFVSVGEVRVEPVKGFGADVRYHRVVGLASTADNEALCSDLRDFFADERVHRVLRLSDRQRETFARLVDELLVPERIRVPFDHDELRV